MTIGKQQQLTKESFRIPKDQSAADNNWGNTALEFVRYKSNTFEYMYVKRWNSKTRSQWGTCTFFGSDTIILGLSSSRYDKNASLLCIAINVVFLDSCNKLTHINCIFSIFANWHLKFARANMNIRVENNTHLVLNCTAEDGSAYISKKGTD